MSPEVVEPSSRVGAEQVEAQLARILSSAAFLRASRPARFLEYIVRQAVSGKGHATSEADIAEHVFERTDFDSRLHPVVRVEAARLRKRLEEYYNTDGAHDPVRIAIPSRGYLPTIALQEPGEDAALNRRQPPPDGKMRLAVLPFVNLSDDDKFDSWCQGLTDETIAATTSLPFVEVISRTASFQYQGESLDTRNVGRDLGVTHVLEGSVRKGDTSLRVTATMVNAETGFTQWSSTFDHPQEDNTVAMQETVARRVAEQVSQEHAR